MPVLIHIHINIIIFEASKLHQKPPPSILPPHHFALCVSNSEPKKTTTQGHSAQTLSPPCLVSGNPLVDRHVLEQVRLLPKGLGAVLAPEGLLPGVGAQVHLDVGLVEEAPVADLAVVHHFLAEVAAVYSTAAAAATAETVAAGGT
jgi:hypothetical protein